MKKILVIHTGGTFGMVPMKPNEILAPGNLQDKLLSHVPEISEIADIEVIMPFNEDSSDVGITIWEHLAGFIDSNMEKYDGFVIIHGTDTMVYTASALSFSLLNLKKPVILTGAQRPLAKLRSDARQNLIDAIEVSTFDIGEVLIVFGQRILRGNRCKKTSISNYDAFFSPNYPIIGNIGLNVDIDENLLWKSREKYTFNPGFNPSLLSIHVYPECDPFFYFDMLEKDSINAVLLVGFGAGNLPLKEKPWLPFIEKSIALGKAVFINSSTAHGRINLELYESGQKALKAGALGCAGMTIEASIVKIMKIMHRTTAIKQVYKSFLINLAGEIKNP